MITVPATPGYFSRDGILVEEYRYDAAGTREYEMNALRNIPGRSFTYSVEDHLYTAGDTAYDYDLDGFLTRKTEGGAVTGYTYSSRGELHRVDLPDGRVIEYIHDPLGRRIARKVDGVITEKYLWSGRTTLLAVFDGSDNLRYRFEYADGRVPFAMTDGSGRKYYLAYDPVGSLRIVADASGNVIKRIDCDTFGNIIADTAPLFDIPSASPADCTTGIPGWCGSGSGTMIRIPGGGPRRIRSGLRAGIRICMGIVWGIR